MTNLILLAVCLLLGILLQKVKSLPKETHVALNVIILHVPLPALALKSIPELQWDISLISLCLVAWIIFGAAYFFFSWVGPKLNWDKKVIGCLILTAGLGNTAFVGFPVIEAVFGKEALKYAMLVDQPGTFLICSSLGIWVGTSFSAGKIPKRELLRRVVVFPPFMAFALAIVLGLMGWQSQGSFKELLERLASILTPLALISVGLQLKWKEIRSDLPYLTMGLGFKLVLAPIIIFALYRLADVPQNLFSIALMEAAMAPMITASILAASYDLQPRLAGLMVGVGVPLSFLTLSAWYQFL